MSEQSDNLEYQAIEANYQTALTNARRAGESALKPKGECFNCEEPLKDERVFCDKDCRSDYEKRKFASKQRLY